MRGTEAAGLTEMLVAYVDKHDFTLRPSKRYVFHVCCLFIRHDTLV